MTEVEWLACGDAARMLQGEEDPAHPSAKSVC